jgi:hypothetical protein
MMKFWYSWAVASIVLAPSLALAGEESLRGSPGSMERQHHVAVEEELTFHRTPQAVLKEVEAGTLTPLAGNEDYRIANVSFAYAVPEVRMMVERLSKQYRAACGEPLVVTSLTRPKVKQPRNAHALSVHPAGMAVDLRISKVAACRVWLENTLLALESVQVLDVTRERMPPHYHVAVYPTPYREYVAKLEAARPEPVIAKVATPPQPTVTHTAMAVVPPRRGADVSWIAPLIFVATCGVTALGALRRRLRQQPR